MRRVSTFLLFRRSYREAITRPSDVADQDSLAVSFLNLDERKPIQLMRVRREFSGRVQRDYSELDSPTVNLRHRSSSCELISRRLSDGAPIDKPVIAADKQISSSFARCGILRNRFASIMFDASVAYVPIRLGQVELILSGAFNFTMAQTDGRGSSCFSIRYPAVLNGRRISGKSPRKPATIFRVRLTIARFFIYWSNFTTKQKVSLISSGSGTNLLVRQPARWQ